MNPFFARFRHCMVPASSRAFIIAVFLSGCGDHASHEHSHDHHHLEHRQASQRHSHPHHGESCQAEDPPNATGQILFTKEEQQRSGFSTVSATLGTVAPSIPAYGTLTVPASGSLIVAAPVEGRLRFVEGMASPEVGSAVARGEVLFEVVPEAGTLSGLVHLQEAFLLARLELERAQALWEQEAVAQRWVQEARIRVRTLEDALGRLGIDPEFLAEPDLRAVVRAARDGVVVGLTALPGQRVAAGDPVLVLEDRTFLVLEAVLPVARWQTFQTAVDAVFRVNATGPAYRVSEMGGTLVSSSPLSAQNPGFARILFQFASPDPPLVPGSRVSVRLLGREGPPGVVIPLEAVQEEQGQALVFVQTGEESVERRFLRLGESDGRMVAVRSGIEVGEQVVTGGAQAIRLASLATSEMGHGHVH